MAPSISVVIPAYNSEASLGDCLRAVAQQSFDRERYEIVVVDDGSTDKTAAVAEQYEVRLLRQANAGEVRARDRGVEAAHGVWVACLDADCIPSRTWLHYLGAAANQAAGSLGAAGALIGYRPATAPARYIELTGGFDVEGHLNHPTYPYAPLGNVMYRRLAWLEVGGADRRYEHYPGPDLHDRLCRRHGGPFFYAPRAIVMHRHPDTWPAYWRQQVRYGRGYASFLLHHRPEFPWGARREMGAWAQVLKLGGLAPWPGRGDQALLRRGHFVKQLAQRVGFVRNYWSPAERRKWNQP